MCLKWINLNIRRIYFFKYNLKSDKMENEKRNRLPDSFYVYPENRDEKLASMPKPQCSLNKSSLIDECVQEVLSEIRKQLDY